MTPKSMFANAVQSLLGRRSVAGPAAPEWTATEAEASVDDGLADEVLTDVNAEAEIDAAVGTDGGAAAEEASDTGHPTRIANPTTQSLVELALAAMAELTALLRAEADAVTTPSKPIQAIVERKAAAEVHYRSLVAALQCEPGGVGALPEPIRRQLTEAAQVLAAAAADNIRIVGLAREAQQRMVDMIVQSVKRHRELEGGYGHLGRTASSPYVKPLPPPPAALDRSF